MLRRIDLTAADDAHPGGLGALLPRALVDVRAAVASVQPVLDAVAQRGYAAAREATLRLLADAGL